MTDSGQQAFPFANAGSQKLRRGVYLLPSGFTTVHLLCGFYAVLAALRGSPADFDHAAWAIGIASVFDVFDGLAARLTHAHSDFGA